MIDLASYGAESKKTSTRGNVVPGVQNDVPELGGTAVRGVVITHGWYSARNGGPRNILGDLKALNLCFRPNRWSC